MRIATWNVNSLKARLEKVEWWLERAAPDVLLLQETKLADDAAPLLPFSMAGYELLHHGEGRWNGVAIASRVGLADVVTNFGDGAVRPSLAAAAGPGDEEDFDPSREARMVSAICGGIRVVSIYAPNGRVVGSPFYAGKLAWFARLRRWLDESARARRPARDRRRLQRGAHGPRRVGSRRRARGDARLRAGAGRHSDPSWTGASRTPGARATRAFDGSRGGTTAPGTSSATRGCGSTTSWRPDPVAARIVAVEVDREARKGKPVPSDHAPLVMDLDAPGRPFDAGWADAAARIADRVAARRAGSGA